MGQARGLYVLMDLADNDLMDLLVFKNGVVVAADEGTGGCPSVTFTAEAGTTYVVELRGFGTSLSGYALQVSP